MGSLWPLIAGSGAASLIIISAFAIKIAEQKRNAKKLEKFFEIRFEGEEGWVGALEKAQLIMKDIFDDIMGSLPPQSRPISNKEFIALNNKFQKFFDGYRLMRKTFKGGILSSEAREFQVLLEKYEGISRRMAGFSKGGGKERK